MTTPILAATNLSFGYGRNLTVHPIAVSAVAGECVGLVGPNGAGKSTLLALLAGLLAPRSGQLAWFGQAAANTRIRRRIGYLPDEAALFEELTGRENLALFVDARGGSDITGAIAAAEALGLTAAQLDARAATYSFGMRRKLALAQTFTGEPDLLLLDEPTLGLDPDARERLAIQLAAYAPKRAILLASNDLRFVEQRCSRVLFLHDGRLVLEGTPAALLQPFQGQAAFRVCARDPIAPLDLEGVGPAAPVDEHTLVYRSDNGVMALPALIDALLRAGNDIVSINVSMPDLTDVFRQVTGTDWTASWPA